MKKLIFLVALVFSLLLLCSCSAGLKPIENLMRPPYSWTERELQKSIDSLLGSEISLCSPESGEFHTAITMRDLDNDGNDEAVVFYQKDRDSSAVRMSILYQSGDKWKILSDFAGSGSSVNSISFSDLNNDTFEDILVSWTLFDNKINKSLTIYSCFVKADSLNIEACATEPFNLMHIEDMFGTGEKQVILVYTDTSKTPQRTSLRMMKMSKKNAVSLVCETKLDANILSLSSILTDKPEKSVYPRIFIDANVADNQMITEVMTWSDSSKNFNMVFSGSNSQPNTVTMRSNNLFCQDIDGDSMIEIPLRRPMEESKDGDISSGYLLEWCDVVGGGLVPKQYYVVNSQENYRLFFPTSWKNKVYVNNSSDRTWNFVDGNGELLFKITSYSLASWDENTAAITEVLLIQNDTVYTCTISDLGQKFGITVTDLLKDFNLDIQ